MIDTVILSTLLVLVRPWTHTRRGTTTRIITTGITCLIVGTPSGHLRTHPKMSIGRIGSLREPELRFHHVGLLPSSAGEETTRRSEKEHRALHSGSREMRGRHRLVKAMREPRTNRVGTISSMTNHPILAKKEFLIPRCATIADTIVGSRTKRCHCPPATRV